MWKEHLKNLSGKSTKVTDKPITKINNQLDIKLGQFTQGELGVIRTKVKSRTAAGLDEIPPEVWETRKFNDLLLRYWNAVYNQKLIERWKKGLILSFPMKGDLGIAKNYKGIILTSIAARIYNALLLKHIELEIEKIRWKNQNGFLKNRSTTSRILTIHRILLGICAKNIEVIHLLVDFSILLHTQREYEANTTSLWSPERNSCSHNDAH